MTDAALSILDECEHENCSRLHSYITNHPPDNLSTIKFDDAHVDDVFLPLFDHRDLRYRIRVFGTYIYVRWESQALAPHWVTDPEHPGDGMDVYDLMDYLNAPQRHENITLEPVHANEVPEEYRQ